MKPFSEAIKVSKGIADLFLAYESNMAEVSKLLTEATNFVKDELGITYWYGQAGPRSQSGWYEKLQPKKYAFSVFYNSKVNNEDITDPNQTDWLLILMILLKENSLNVNQETISLSLLHYNCLNAKGSRAMGNEWEYQALASMKRKDWCKYSKSDWSDKAIKVVRNDLGNISHLLCIPVGVFDGVDDFPIVLKPAIESLIKQDGKLLNGIEPYIPEGLYLD